MPSKSNSPTTGDIQPVSASQDTHASGDIQNVSASVQSVDGLATLEPGESVTITDAFAVSNGFPDVASCIASFLAAQNANQSTPRFAASKATTKTLGAAIDAATPVVPPAADAGTGA